MNEKVALLFRAIFLALKSMSINAHIILLRKKNSGSCEKEWKSHPKFGSNLIEKLSKDYLSSIGKPAYRQIDKGKNVHM